MGPKPLPVVVVGAGIGGLTAALALAKQGYRVQVLEQTDELGAIGYGIQLGPNVFPMFERLGIADDVLTRSYRPTALLWLDALDGSQIARIDTRSRLIDRFAHPYVVIHRVDLHNVLLASCQSTGQIQFLPGVTATSFEQFDDRVRVQTTTGQGFDGAALIGADGLRSTIRAQLLGAQEPRPTGYVAHRGVVPIDRIPPEVPRDEVLLWSGPGYHIVHYPLRDHSVFNVVAVFRTPTFAEKLSEQDYRREIAQVYSGAHPAMQSLIKLVGLERRWPIADRYPTRKWSEGLVALIGDAAHPTLQSYAQGAGMAIEDSVCLADVVASTGGDFAAAFPEYTRQRRVRTSRVQLESRYLWEVYHAEDLARDVRTETFSEYSEEQYYRCLSWLWGGHRPDASRPGAPRALGS